MALDTVEAEFVRSTTQIQGGQLSDLAGGVWPGQRSGQFRQQDGAGEVADAEAVYTGTTAQGFQQKTFADATVTDQDEIAFAADEVAGGQFLDLRPMDSALEVPVELLQQTDLAEARVADTTFDGPLAPLIGQATQQTVGELQVRPTFLFGLGQQGVKRLAHGGDLQGIQVVQQQAA